METFFLQLAAAVVAQQVVSQMAPVLPTVAPLDPLLAPALIAATPGLAPLAAPITAAIAAPISAPITATLNQAPIGIPIIPKELPCNVSLLNQLEHTPSEMVTVPKNVSAILFPDFYKKLDDVADAHETYTKQFTYDLHMHLCLWALSAWLHNCRRGYQGSSEWWKF